MSITSTVTIFPYTPALKEHIKTLNLEWLTKFFKVELKDEKVLSDPQGEIIDQGGFIFYAQYQNEIVGTASLLKMEEGVFELSKMAVTDAVQGLGIGKDLLQHCIDFAEKEGFSKLVLYSNRKLHSAIHLYRKYGFVEIELEDGVYERADIKMEKPLTQNAV